MTDFKSFLQATDSMVFTDAPIVTASGIDSERKQPNLIRSIDDGVADNDEQFMSHDIVGSVPKTNDCCQNFDLTNTFTYNVKNSMNSIHL